MKERGENKLSMYHAVKGVCNDHQVVWNGMPAFANAFSSFDTKIGEIEAAADIQSGVVTGITKDKQKEEDEMIAMAVKIAGAVFAYASINGKNELKDRVDYSKSAMSKARDSELLSICRNILNVANEHVDFLADFGITAEKLTTFDGEIADFADALSKPREAITRRSEATSRLVELFFEADNILKEQMDPLMEMYKDSNRDFYNQYKAARMIIDLGN